MHGLKPMHLDSKSECTGYCKRCMVFFGLLKSHWTALTGLYLLDAGETRKEIKMRNFKEVPLANLFAFPICVSYP